MNLVRLLRPAAAIVLAVVWTYLAMAMGVFFGFAGESLGWLWVTLLAALGLVPAALLWGAAHRRIAIAVAIVLTLGVGGLSWYTAPPSRDRIVATAETVAVPEGWKEVSENESGDSWCWMGCPELVREYEVSGDSAQAHADLRDNLEADGWAVDESRDGQLTKGRWRVTIHEQTHTDTPTLSVSFSG